MKRYFWLVNVAGVALCSALAGTAVVRVVEGAYLTETPRRARRPVPRVERDRPEPRAKTGAAIVERNMFCSTCEPPSAEPAPLVSADGTPVKTSLPLELVATTIAGKRDRSFATIRDHSAERLGAYRVGEGIPGAGAVVAIGPRYVDFENTSAGRVERLDLLDEAAEPKRKRKRPKRTRNKRRGRYADLDDRIRKIDDTHYEVDRSLINTVLTNPRKLGRARIVPSVKNGKPNGFKVYRVRRTSPLARIGIKNGDTIHAVNGFEISSPDKALEAYTKLRSANSVRVSLTRRGKSKTLHYSIQ